MCTQNKRDKRQTKENHSRRIITIIVYLFDASGNLWSSWCVFVPGIATNNKREWKTNWLASRLVFSRLVTASGFPCMHFEFLHAINSGIFILTHGVQLFTVRSTFSLCLLAAKTRCARRLWETVRNSLFVFSPLDINSIGRTNADAQTQWTE